MKKLLNIFFVLFLTVSVNAWADENYAAKIAEKIDITQTVISVQLNPMLKLYPCLDDNFKNQWTKLNQEASKIANVEEGFVKFLSTKETNEELKNISDTLSSEAGSTFIDDLRNPKFKDNVALYYPSLENNKDDNITKIAGLFSEFTESAVLNFKLSENPELKENMKKLGELTLSYFQKENGEIKCKQPTTNN